MHIEIRKIKKRPLVCKLTGAHCNPVTSHCSPPKLKQLCSFPRMETTTKTQEENKETERRPPKIFSSFLFSK
jgi:hypothetical protein